MNQSCKRFLFLLLALTLFCFTGLTFLKQSESYLSKIDPSILPLLHNYRAYKRLYKYKEESPEKRVLLRAKILFSGSRKSLEKSGIIVSSFKNNIGVVKIPLDKLRDLAKNKKTIYIEGVKTLYPSLNVVLSETRIDLIHNLEVPYKGKNVIIGIIDSGIDWQHDDFRKNDGTTRIKYLWDQTSKMGNPPEGFTKGAEYTEYDINDELDGTPVGYVREKDTNGHGTNVAGVAAGDGSAMGGGYDSERYVGVAPEADLIVVKAGEDRFPDDNVIDGIRYIIKKAGILGKPCVINLSLGNQIGPHDGTSILEREIANEAGRGKIFVVAAGNDGNSNIHIEGNFSPAENEYIFKFYVPSYTPNSGEENDNVMIDLWYDGNSKLKAKLITPSGNNIGPVYEGEANRVSTIEGSIIYNVAAGGYDPRNNLKEVYFYIRDESSDKPPASGEWKFLISGNSGHFDGWMESTMDAYFTEGNITQYKLLAHPSNAYDCITVGAYVSKNWWYDKDGNKRMDIGANVGDISLFSSPGPTRDGRKKPEITAPGEKITTSLSVDSRNADAYFIDPDKVHITVQGTSFSAPVVSGLVALMLEKDPTLKPDIIISLLRDNARKDEFTGNVWNEKWGYGKLDGFSTFKSIKEFFQTELWASKVIDVSSNPETAIQALGKPDTYPNYGDFSTAWSPASESSEKEWIELGFDKAILLNKVSIYETYNPGAIDSVFARGIDGYLHLLGLGGLVPAGDSARVFELSIPATNYLVESVLISLNPSKVPGKNEIDAVKITGFEGMGGGDVHPPEFVGEVSVKDIKMNSADIFWQTDEPATSEIMYGLNKIYENYFVDSLLKLSHHIKLSNLFSGRTYYFKVGSRDERGNGPSWSRSLLFNTADVNGNLWELTNYDFKQALTGMYFSSDSVGWITGIDGLIIKTTDGGKNWNSRVFTEDFKLKDIFFIDDNLGWVCGKEGVILYTFDGGQQWFKATKLTENMLRAVYFVDKTEGWVAGDNGTIMKSNDGGINWRFQISGVDKNLYDISFINSHTGFIVGEGGTVLKTTNGGEKWNILNIQSKEDIRKIFFLDKNYGWFAGKNSTIYITTDGGNTWIKSIFDEPLIDINSIFFVSKDSGWFAGEKGAVFFTGDGGFLWNEQKTGINEVLKDIFFINNARGWAITY
ncbi:hypothetical protein DRQ09_08450, partial [candidate division KSB1 bacterium]